MVISYSIIKIELGLSYSHDSLTGMNRCACVYVA